MSEGSSHGGGLCVIISRKIIFDILRELDVVKARLGNTEQPSPGVTIFILHLSPFIFFILSLVNDCGSHRKKNNFCLHIIEKIFDAVKVTYLISVNMLWSNPG